MSDKSRKALKRNLKFITKKTLPRSFDDRTKQLKSVQEGWLNYFRMASIYGKLQGIDSWVRNRLRMCIWHDWKKTERKRKNLIRLGIPSGKAYAWSRSKKGQWAIAQSPILLITITLERLQKRGYESMLDHYCKVAPHYNEPLYTRPVRTVV